MKWLYLSVTVGMVQVTLRFVSPSSSRSVTCSGGLYALADDVMPSGFETEHVLEHTTHPLPDEVMPTAEGNVAAANSMRGRRLPTVKNFCWVTLPNGSVTSTWTRYGVLTTFSVSSAA